MMNLVPLMLLQAVPVTPPAPVQTQSPPPSRLEACMRVADDNPEDGIALANSWLAEAPGIEPRHCLGVAFIRAGNPAAALPPLLSAANEAENAQSLLRGMVLSFVGIAMLRNGEPQGARDHFTRAIDSGTLSNNALGNTLALRARVAVALNDLAAARADLDRSLAIAPENGGSWLMSATLARRARDYARAQADIQQAAALLPREPGVALEAGNIAFMVDNHGAARRSWESAIAIDPAGPVGASARRRIADMEEEQRAEANLGQASRVPTPNAADQPVPITPAPATPPQSR